MCYLYVHFAIYRVQVLVFDNKEQQHMRKGKCIHVATRPSVQSNNKKEIICVSLLLFLTQRLDVYFRFISFSDDIWFDWNYRLKHSDYHWHQN